MKKSQEDPEEGVSSSESSVRRKHGYHAATERTLHRSRSCESLKSDWSMEPPFHFKRKQDSTDKSIKQGPQSCVSLKSDWSMELPFHFKHRTLHRSRSCESLKSDWSMEPPFHFKHKQDSTDKRNHQRPPSPVQSYVSLKSDWSMEPPFHFKRGVDSADKRTLQRSRSCESLKSDWSMEPPFHFKRGRVSNESVQQRSEVTCPTDQGSILMLLEEKMVTFVKEELKIFNRILNPDYQEFSEESRQDEAVDSEEVAQWGSSKEAVVKIAIHFLRMMKQDDLADCLQSRMAAVSCQYKHKSNLKKKYQCVFEGITKAGNPVLLNQIYTELYVTEGDAGGVNDEHEVRQIEIPSRKPARLETTISCKEIFKPLPDRDRPVRTVMTKGVAGIGKTVLTQKVTLDWAENKANHKIQFIFPFTFRELNVLKEKHYSLVEFVHNFFNETKEARICSFEDFHIVFIFDGLDECRLPLDFDNNQTLTDVTESTSVDVLLTNLITGKLLPTARLWITTRPAAANQIPAEYVDMVTEVRGFTDPQKEEYFRKRFSDERQTRKLISHIKKSRSLHIMCHIPVFCWITATVLEDVMKTREGAKLPKNLTEMYIHFLVVQAKLKNVKYDRRSETDPHWSLESRKIIESLGKLAFEQLQKGHLIFYESDLTECGIDIRAASVYSGVFTEIFKEERGLYQDKVFCFIHLSVQEFLAALYVHLTFFNTGVNLLSETQSTSQRSKPVNDKAAAKVFYRTAVGKALKSPNGHMDLFLRFLLGLSVASNQSLLQGLMKQIQRSSQICQETVLFIKEMIAQNLSPEMNINLFHCLYELNDQSLMEEIQRFLSSGSLRQDRLSPAQWSALVFILLSEKEVDVFDLRKYSPSEEGLLRLLPVVKVSRKSVLSGCNLSNTSCAALASLLRTQSSLLRELDLSYTEVQDSGLMVLSAHMTSPHCKLEALRLSGCKLTYRSCHALLPVLSSNLSKLKKLDLSNNSLQDSGLTALSDGLQSLHCKLEFVKLSGCNLLYESCDSLASVLRCQSSGLRELDMSNNDLQDSGVYLLSTGLKSPHCVLETLSLSGCLLTEESCTSLASALIANPSHLRELDLSYNHPGDGVKLLCARQNDPECKLDIVRIDYAGIHRLKPGLKKYACELQMDSNTAHRKLCLFENNTVTDEEEEQPYSDNPKRFQFWYQMLCSNSLTGRCYWEVDWMGLVSVGVTYRGIRRTGSGDESLIGGNASSWTLDCSPSSYFVWHNNKGKIIPRPVPVSARSRVGVYVDWCASTVSFYTVSSDTLAHIHTFYCPFTEPLHPAFRIRSEFTFGLCNSVSLRPMDED